MTADKWPQPPQTTTAAGAERRCGVEIEYIDVPLQRSAEIIAELWDGTIEWQHKHHATISTKTLGAFTVELDVQWMQKLSEHARTEKTLGQMPFAETADNLLSPMVSSIAPNEIVTPPIPFSRLHELTPLVQQLREAGAKGTGDSVIYAFGVHLNPEIPSTDVAVLRDYLRAFLLLSDWMRHAMQVDATRNLTGFARAFPIDYVRLIMEDYYTPSIHRFINDYLLHNPTRNRALDMLPLLAYIDESAVKAKVEDTLVKPRPTFHFRLPNCHIDRIDWDLSQAWKYWLEVEKLAADKPKLRAMQESFLRHHDSPLYLFSDAWREETRQWLQKDPA